jgi:hypothetical protein
MPTWGEMFLQLFDEKQAIETPHWVQLLDSRIQKLHEGEEDSGPETTYCTSYIASVGKNIVAIMNMSVSNDWYEQEQDGELWKTALKKIGWKLKTESDEFSMSIELRIYDFHKKIVLILDVMCPSEGVDFGKYHIDLQRPENVRDIANITLGEARCLEPDEDQKKLLMGVYRIMLRLIQPIWEHHRCEGVSAPLLIE